MSEPRLDRRIQLQSRDTTRNADGSQANTWTTTATIWAGKKDVPSVRRGQMFSSDQNSDTLFTEWTIRWRAGITGAERIVGPDGAVYQVIGVPQEVDRRKYLILVSERGVVK